MLTIDVLGPLAVNLDGRHIKLPKKTRALLVYLAMQPAGAIVARSRLSDLLWPYQSPEQARHSLRNCLLELRKTITPHAVFSADYHHVVSLSEQISSDVMTFERLAGSNDISELSECRALYRGDCLSELSIASASWEEWIAHERDRLRRLFVDVLFRLSVLSNKAGDHHTAIAAARQLVGMEGLLEPAHRLLMRVFSAAGRGSEAIRFYAQVEETLQRELGVKPAAQTQQLLRRIRLQTHPMNGTAGIVPSPASGEIAVLRAQTENISGENAALKSAIADLAAAFFEFGERLESMLLGHKREAEIKPAA